MADNSISIRTNFPAVIKSMKKLSDEEAPKVMARALNDTITQGRTHMARQISQEFRVTSAQAKQRLQIQKAAVRGGVLHLSVSLKATGAGRGRGMNLINFIVKKVSIAEARRRMRAGEGGSQTLRSGGSVRKALELQFQIKRGGGKKTIKGAFLGNNGRTVFTREGSSRLPVKALSTIDIPQMFNTKRVNQAVKDIMLDRFEKNFTRQFRAALRGYIK